MRDCAGRTPPSYLPLIFLNAVLSFDIEATAFLTLMWAGVTNPHHHGIATPTAVACRRATGISMGGQDCGDGFFGHGKVYARATGPLTPLYLPPPLFISPFSNAL